MIQVIKRNGEKEDLDLEKIHRVVEWACEGITGVSPSEIELKSRIQFHNNIQTKDIHETMIKSSADLISEETPNYQYVAGRLINYHLRKEVYGDYNPTDLYSHYVKHKNQGYYTDELLTWYSEKEWQELNDYIIHDRDDDLTYAAMEQLRGKYLIKNRVTGQIFETPQIAFMLLSMTLFGSYKKDRLYWVKELYDAISTFDISLPTPIMAGVRTPDKQFSSCVLIETDDSLDSINATASSIVKYISRRAGIGIGAGKIRGIESPIRNGAAVHTGVIPFYKYFQAAVKSCSQGALRGGAATLHYPFWHIEVESLLVLKNNKGTEESRVRHLDYSVQFNKVLYERLIQGGNITLFSPDEVPDLYDAFFVDNDKFKELYEKYERAYKIRKKTIPAIDLFTQFMQERKDTGRVYFMNVDHCNDHGAFIKEETPIRLSNLCQEITLPAKPLNSVDDLDGEISLCTLAAVNLGKIRHPDQFKKPCKIAVRALNAILDYQEYPIPAAERSTLGRRPLGIGLINLAYWLAKNNTNYSNPNLDLFHEYIEAWAYYLTEASLELAEENGPCPLASQTKYSRGILPIDTYKKDVDELVPNNLKKDWEGLKKRIEAAGGLYNSTLMAQMPAETSAQVSNSTNGVEPPRNLVSVKQSKDGSLSQVVPEISRLKNKYELLWDQKTPEGYLKLMAVLQKFVDQSISTNTSYNPLNYENEEIPMSVLLGDLLKMYKWGIKTGYYFNTYVDKRSPGGYDMIIQDTPPEIDDDCESCKI